MNWLDDMLEEVTHTSGAYFYKQASDEDVKTVEKYLAKTYPKETLNWVGHADWKRKKVSLDDIKMDRRPGGAREVDKVKNIAKAFESNEDMEPVVLVKTPEGKMKVADGYHRTLGCKHAGSKSIDAWVGSVNMNEGPWDKEMHEKKLNKGSVEKKADLSLEGFMDDWLGKEAAPSIASLGRLGTKVPKKKNPLVVNPAGMADLQSKQYMQHARRKPVPQPSIETPQFSTNPLAKLAGDFEKEAAVPLLGAAGKMGMKLLKGTGKSVGNFAKGITFAGNKASKEAIKSAADPKALELAKKNHRGLKMNQAKSYAAAGAMGAGYGMNEYGKSVKANNDKNPSLTLPQYNQYKP